MPTTAGLATLTEFDVPIPMRDGVVLRANITRPADGEPAPVLLIRSPYPLEAIRFEVDTIGRGPPRASPSWSRAPRHRGL
ncbi:hypothetical protein AU252_10080 [Pseudarthrobacter sulfonivorans]|uniref:Xaa-Pro dipeptidyl-peptidase-like domain-containing protein n=2 Tax=Pseudarthrobacter sulfonivorans TaxID=121292 RepID=A0A0U3Q499_9MICC|nr:hypothetical protein AU252_10080 [Pseudarthrobacter sulfonivorans]